MLVVTWTIILCNFLVGNCAFYYCDRTSLINGQDFIQVAPNLIISMQEISLGLSCAYLHNGFCWSQFNCWTRIWVHTHSSGRVPLNPLSFLEETNHTHTQKKELDHLVVKNSEIFLAELWKITFKSFLFHRSPQSWMLFLSLNTNLTTIPKVFVFCFLLFLHNSNWVEMNKVLATFYRSI